MHVMVNWISPGTVGMWDSKAFGIFLLGFKSSLGIELVQHQQSRRIQYRKSEMKISKKGPAMHLC